MIASCAGLSPRCDRKKMMCGAINYLERCASAVQKKCSLHHKRRVHNTMLFLRHRMPHIYFLSLNFRMQKKQKKQAKKVVKKKKKAKALPVKKKEVKKLTKTFEKKGGFISQPKKKKKASEEDAQQKAMEELVSKGRLRGFVTYTEILHML